MAEALFVGIDVGTSGVRAVAIDAAGVPQGEGRAAMAEAGGDGRDPAVWWRAAERALGALFAVVAPERVRAIAVDGTSGTMLPVAPDGTPLAAARLYNDASDDRAILERIAAHAPADSAAHGATSGLAKALAFQAAHPHARLVHQADWVAGRLCGRFVSDENNALKTGYDPLAGRWPDWLERTGLDVAALPEVLASGTPVAPVTPAAAAAFGLAREAVVVAGTTDGCAAFLATGAGEPGEGVTSLGSTLVIKLLSERPVFAPQYGVYSHKLLGRWLPGGASNTGGAVLLAHFSPDALAALSARIDPATDSGLDYYPLTRPGERFPIADPALAPVLTPRPADDAAFLHGLLEGMARVEAMAYARLAELGGGALAAVRTVGGGARNPTWTALRARRLGVPMREPASEEAAVGAARLALHGAGA